MATEYMGDNAYLVWVCPAGTIGLNADYRTFDLGQGGTWLDNTAGNDQTLTSLPNRSQFDPVVELLAQTGGTALEDALKYGTEGTLICGPEGTIAGKRKYTVHAFSQGASFKLAYNDLAQITANFKGTGNSPTTVYGTF